MNAGWLQSGTSHRLSARNLAMATTSSLPDRSDRPKVASTFAPGAAASVALACPTLIATPGHTPGHQSLLVKLPKTRALLLSGDAVHFKDNWENHRVPDINFNTEQTAASLQRMAEVLAKEKAQLWINHDKAQRDSLKMAPGFYD
jgi:glyoxylase-like metal-dependent hydrolase (beta-lactamase superfamily II)